MPTQLKICGLTNLSDARYCAGAGVDYLGFIQYPKSPRYLEPAQAKALLEWIAGPKNVGVFVNESAEWVNETVADVGFDLAQLHGMEPPEVCAEIAVPVIKAVHVGAETQLADLTQTLRTYEPVADFFLLDTQHPEQWGGTGEAFDWSIAAALARDFPIFLAGGLRTENLAEALATVQPFALDVSSNLESAPGQKDFDKLTAFLDTFATLNAGDAVKDTVYTLPTATGHFGRYGGRFVPETLMPALDALTATFHEAWQDDAFRATYRHLLHDYVGRPTPLTFANRLTDALGGAKIYLKREDLCHTGAHKINNTIGQILLAQRMGKTRIIAETGAGQHGVATATVCAKFGLPCVVYMGAEDIERQHLNVQRMRLLGAEVRPATTGSQTLKDATNEAIRDWVTHVETTHYIIGSVVGPHPYPMMVREFHRVIGEEVQTQLQAAEGRSAPDVLVACIGGGSNAMGLFAPFLDAPHVALHGAEAAGEGLDRRHAATLTQGTPGVLHGSLSYLLQDAEGQVALAHSISAGLDYPGVGPEHAHLKETRHVTYHAITDAEALDAVKLLARTEGILPALETAHAIALTAQLAPQFPSDHILILNCSGRGDKDMPTIANYL